MTDECASAEVDCSKVLNELAVYLDGEMSDEELRAQLGEHLSDCPPCKDRADLEDCVKQLVRDRCCEEAPAGLKAKLEAKLMEWSR